jgi:hypothetical protein
VSYDLTLFVPTGGTPPETQLEALDERASEPVTAGDRKRLLALREGLAALDPTAQFEDIDDGFVVPDAEALPGIEVSARKASISMSMASDSHALYRSLHQALPVFAAQGYVAYDYQLGGFVKPQPDFRAFMEQFRSQFDSAAGFEGWMSRDRDAPRAPPAAPPPEKKVFPFYGIFIGTVIIIWGLYKLHKAGYF